MEFKSKEERDKFILENVKLVDFVINRRFAGYYKNENTYDDLKQVGIIGLIKSVDSFDENKGNKFSTYAIPYILGTILREFRGKRNGIVYGRKITANKYKIEEMLLSMTVKEVAKKMDMTVKEVEKISKADLTMVSLDKECYKDGHFIGTYADTLSLSYKEDYDTNMYIEYLFSKLSEEEKYIITEIFYNNCSQQQVGFKIGVSQMQVSRIMRKALKKMKECA